MKNYRLYIQFFSPDGLPTARGEFTVQALNLFTAKQIKENELKECGYSLNEFLIYKIEIEK